MRRLLMLLVLVSLTMAGTAQAVIDWAGQAYPNSGHDVVPTGDQFVVAQVNKAGVTDSPGQDTYPSMSPDGKHIVFESYRDGHAEIYRMNADGSGVVRLTHFEGPVAENDEAPPGNSNPSWSPR